MCPKAVRINSDNCSGHSCWPPRPAIEGSPDVFINNIPSVRLGDAWQVHCCKSCHSGASSSGSPNVFVNGKPKCRIGDAISCGSTMVNGSPDVFVN